MQVSTMRAKLSVLRSPTGDQSSGYGGGQGMGGQGGMGGDQGGMGSGFGSGGTTPLSARSSAAWWHVSLHPRHVLCCTGLTCTGSFRLEYLGKCACISFSCRVLDDQHNSASTDRPRLAQHWHRSSSFIKKQSEQLLQCIQVCAKMLT